MRKEMLDIDWKSPKMWPRNVRRYIGKLFPRKYENVVEPLWFTTNLEKIVGAAVMVTVNTPGNRLVPKFTWLGFICFFIWYSFYFYCSYVSFAEDQTILRHLYKTKLQHYGDLYEKIQSLFYVVFAMWKLPFDLSGDTKKLQAILDIDKAIENLGEQVDYSFQVYVIVLYTVVNIAAGLLRLFSMWLIPAHLNYALPIEKIYQVIFTDVLALLCASHYCSYLLVLKARYKIINNVLNRIRSREAWEYTIFVREKRATNTQKAVQLQEKMICEKIKACARIYSMLYRATTRVNKLYGLAIVLTMFVCLNFIVLNMFYFMEGTAHGLFYDFQKYMDFMFYVFWQIVYALIIILLYVYYGESTVSEAKNTSSIIHEIINNDLGSNVTSEAMQLSMQLLHQVPRFTALGFYDLNNVLLLNGARSVTTFLVLLLQFVMDAR